AGSSLLQALDEAVHEFRGQPVAQEFSRVLADIRLGRTRAESFLAMRERLQDSEVGGVIGSILQGEHLGTPLAQVFRMQADVLRGVHAQPACYGPPAAGYRSGGIAIAADAAASTASRFFGHRDCCRSHAADRGFAPSSHSASRRTSAGNASSRIRCRFYGSA